MFVNYVLLKICQQSVQYKKVISNNQTYEQQLHYFVRIPKFRYQYSVLWNIFFYFIFFQKKKKKTSHGKSYSETLGTEFTSLTL